MNTYNNSNDGASVLGLVIFILIYFAVIFVVLLVTIIGTWKVYHKAGRPGWAALIPIYNNVVWCDIVGRPLWWVLLLFVPGVNVVIGIILALDLAKSYGKDEVYGILLILFPYVMMPVLGFSDARYVGPSAAGAAQPVPAPAGMTETGQPVPPAPSIPQPPASATESAQAEPPKQA